MLPHLVDNLPTLLLRSTGGRECGPLEKGCFRTFLPALTNLRTLNITFGDFKDKSNVQTIYKVLPPNLTALYFRGPASLPQPEHWVDWLRAFESPVVSRSYSAWPLYWIYTTNIQRVGVGRRIPKLRKRYNDRHGRHASPSMRLLANVELLLSLCRQSLSCGT